MNIYVEVLPFHYLMTFFNRRVFPCGFALLGGSFVFLHVGPSILILVFPFLGALVNLWLIGFIICIKIGA